MTSNQGAPRPRKGNKPTYRALNPQERDLIYAFYDKHNGNMRAMTRDHECPYKSYAQIHHYCHLYGFKEQFISNRTKKTQEVIDSLPNAKMDAVQRALDMVRVRQVPLKDQKGNPFLDADGVPFFYEVYPTDREIKTAWEIIKTELGEPTSVSKTEVNNPQSEETQRALDIIESLAHGKSPTDTSAVSRERGAADDPAEVSPAVRDDIHEESSTE